MATRQYIGARYVPKFYENSEGTAEWRGGVAYEPLTIVTYNSNSYTSKKSVPADVGNPSDNPEYWAATGNYNAQVEEYREEVINFKREIENDFAKPLRKTIIIHDSYGTIDNNFIDHIQNISTFVLGENLFKYGAGGCGLLSGTKKYIDFLNDAGTALASQANEIEYIIVEGFQNDNGQTLSDMQNACSAFVIRANELFPNAKVCMCICSLLKGAQMRKATKEWMFAFNNANGINKYVYDLTVSLHNYSHNDESNHPDTYNSMQLAKNIINVVYGNGIALPYSTEALIVESYNLADDVTLESGVTTKLAFSLDHLGISNQTNFTAFRKSAAVNKGTSYVVGNLNSNFISPQLKLVSFPCSIVLGGYTYNIIMEVSDAGILRFIAPVDITSNQLVTLTFGQHFIPWVNC